MALLNFIPNIGPILAGALAVPIALFQSPTKALYTLILYIAMQSLEGFVLTPLAQKQTVNLPPALLISAQVLAGVLLGGFGLLVATPLMAASIVLVKMLYIQDVLGNVADERSSH